MIIRFVLVHHLTRLAIVLAALSFCVFVMAASDTAAQPKIELIAELRVPQATGGAVFIPATVFEQGQEIDYTLRITNPSVQPMDEVTVVQPMPTNTRYVAGSATGAGANIQFSVDGGQSFASATAVKSLRDPQLPAKPEEYTHIRWQLRYVLAPRAVVLARFRAVFN